MRLCDAVIWVDLGPSDALHVVFVNVNQVLVRLWARRRSRCLTGKSSLCKEGVSATRHEGNYVQRRRKWPLSVMGVGPYMYVLSKMRLLSSSAEGPIGQVRNTECFIGVDGSCAWWVNGASLS